MATRQGPPRPTPPPQQPVFNQGYASQIARRVSYLNGQGIGIKVNTNAGGYRIEDADSNRDISPRLTAREMVDWLDAFETGYDIGKEAGVKTATHGTGVKA